MKDITLNQFKLKWLTYRSLFLEWLVNSGLFYIGWIYILKGVIEGNYNNGVLFTLCVIIMSIYRSPHRLFEATLIVSLAILGPLLDTLLAWYGILSYQGTFSCCPWLAPPWTWALWGLFATSINHSLAWVGRTWWLTVLVGAFGGTMSYVAVIKAGAAEYLVSQPVGISYLVLAWGIVLPLCYSYNRWLRRHLVR
jgi:hypothetical protein